MTIILRSLAWCLAAAVSFATLGPARDRPHAAILTHAGEHAFAFILVGLAFGLAYPGDRRRLAAISVGLIGILELLQLWVPGRHARLGDFVVDALTAVAGILIAAAFDRLHARRTSVGVS